MREYQYIVNPETMKLEIRHRPAVLLDQTTPQTITAADTTITASDEIYFGDATDSFKIKKDTIQGILDLTPAPDLSGLVPYAGATGAVNLGAQNLTTTGTIYNKADNSKHFFGAGDDASIYYNGTHLIIDPQEVGAGGVYISDANIIMGDDKTIGTANAYILFDETQPSIECAVGAKFKINYGATARAYLDCNGDSLFTDKVMFTQTDGNEYIDSLADGYLDFGATTAVRSQGTFQTINGVIGKITTVTDTYTVLVTDETVICNKATAFTVTLPTAVVGQKFTIKNINTGTVTVDGAGTDTIDGSLTQSLIQWESFEVQCYAANKWGIQ